LIFARPGKKQNGLAHFGEAVADAVAQGFAVDVFAFEDDFRGFDYRAHLFDGVGAGIGDGFGDGGVHLGVAGAGGEISFEDGEFFGFLFGEFGAVAFSELVDGFLALLDEGLKDLDRFVFVESADFFDFFVLDGGLDAAQDAEAEFVLGAHGVDQVFLDFLGKCHGRNIAEECRFFYTEAAEGTEVTEKRELAKRT
jgi:hypothetical protein